MAHGPCRAASELLVFWAEILPNPPITAFSSRERIERGERWI